MSYTADPGVVGLDSNRRRMNSFKQSSGIQFDENVTSVESSGAVVAPTTTAPPTRSLRARSDSGNLDEHGNKQIVWGSEDEAVLTRKHEAWRKLREWQQQEIKKMITPRDVVLASLVVWIVHKLSLRLRISTLKASGSLLLVGFLKAMWDNRAPPRVLLKNSAEDYNRNWPIFGQIGVVYEVITKGGTRAQMEAAKRRDFKTNEMVMFGGVHDYGLMDPKDREYFLRTNWRNFVKNAANTSSVTFQEAFAEVMGRGIFAVDGDEWADHRKIASHLFSANGLRNKMESSFIHHGEVLVKGLERSWADTGKVLNFQEAMACFTFSTICDVAFGMDPGSLEEGLEGRKIDFLVRFDRIQQMSVLRIILPGPVWKAMRYFNVGSERKIREDATEISRYVTKIVVDRRNSKEVESKEDLLSMYIKTARATGKKYLEEDAYLHDAILNFMVAGRDTSSATLTFLFAELATNPAAEKKLVAEFERVVGHGKEVTWDKMADLRYARAVFNETLRLHPPVGADFRVAASDDVFPSGVRVKAGDRVTIPNVAIGRDPHLWKNPDAFVPERWINPETPEEPVRRVDEYVHPVFWGGPRLCLGKDMAALEVLCVAWTILKRYRVEVMEHSDKVVNGPVQFLEGGLPVKIWRRA